jgi:hypothetical protein
MITIDFFSTPGGVKARHRHREGAAAGLRIPSAFG